MTRPTRAIINLDALRHNYILAQSLAPASQTIAVIKANAYGHGAVPVAKALESLAPAFAVACIEEALELRESGINKPILLMDGFFSVDELALAAEHDFWVMVHHQKQVEQVTKTKLTSPIKVWLKMDTGMHRLGIAPAAFKQAYDNLLNSANVQDEIILTTHLSCSEEAG